MADDNSSQRWGISEWFGEDFFSLTDDLRVTFASDALKSIKEVNRPCPHLAPIIVDARCNKKGGICSTQLYREDADGNVSAQGTRVSICPLRLVSLEVLRDIAENVLGVDDAYLVKEVPYSHSMILTSKNGTPKTAGRIDWLLVDANDLKSFCAVETQSVYMSGKSQDNDFKELIQKKGRITMPTHTRHPDYKSSVPKRLGPQLESKARHLTNAGKKTVVLVDTYVLENMSPLREVQLPVSYEKDASIKKQRMLETCEVVFAFISLERKGGSSLPSYSYATIDDSRQALDAVAPIPISEFFETVKNTVTSRRRDKRKVIPLNAGKGATGALF